MKATLIIVPPGGGKYLYSLDFELPAIPQVGDYISVRRPGQEGTEDFIVRRNWWELQYPNLVGEGSGVGKVNFLLVECELAKGINSNPSHLAGYSDRQTFQEWSIDPTSPHE
ncbi:MAG: alpha/beta hydrolase [Chthonomonadaceae bacterium]|nr:alpha/beta hydrolase [Chthonomonadaceae bacterium]